MISSRKRQEYLLDWREEAVAEARTELTSGAQMINAGQHGNQRGFPINLYSRAVAVARRPEGQ